MNEANLDNALVEQKNALWTAIHNATDVDALQAANDLLDFAAPLWTACNYEYKVHETRTLLRLKAADLLDAEREELTAYRKSSSLWHITVNNIRKLEALAS